MTSQVFYRKWRPQTLAEVVGQEQVTQTLLHALSGGRVSHAYLFCGPRGTGKTTTGRILAKAVNCLTNGKGEPCNACSMCQAITEARAFDIIEIDAASNRGIDEIRDLCQKVGYAPNQASYKVYIIDEVHMLTKEASNALLKTLEEPPPYVIFVLAATEAHKILPTIMSRCQRFDFRRLSQADIVAKLTRICQEESIQMKPEALRLIARAATGSLRDAENLLEQLTTYYGAEVEFHQVQVILGITGDWRVKELVKHIVNNNVSAGITTINSVDSDGLDLRQFNRELVEYLRVLLLIKTGADEAVDFTIDDITELKDLAASASLPQILKVVKLFGELDLGSYSTLPLELALVDCTLSVGGQGEILPEQAEQELRQSERVAAPPSAPTPAKQPVVVPEPITEAEQPIAAPEPADVSSPSVPAEAAVTPLEPGSDMERLGDWRQVIEQAPEETKRTPAIAILRSAGVKPVQIENDTVVLSFRYDFHKEKMDKRENQQVAEKIISNFLGHPCRVRCIYQPGANHMVEAAKKMGAQVTSVEEK